MPTDRPGGEDQVWSALAEFARVWSDVALIAEVAPTLGCEEARAMVALLTSVGRTEAATLWLSYHAAADQPDDEHWTPPPVVVVDP